MYHGVQKGDFTEELHLASDDFFRVTMPEFMYRIRSIAARVDLMVLVNGRVERKADHDTSGLCGLRRIFCILMV